MLDADHLTNEAHEILKAFPSSSTKSMRLKLWEVIRNEDWGHRVVSGFTERSDRDSVSGNAVFWFGGDGCLMYILYVVFVVPPVWVRNLLVAPVYERRIAAVIDDVLPQRTR